MIAYTQSSTKRFHFVSLTVFLCGALGLLYILQSAGLYSEIFEYGRVNTGTSTEMLTFTYGWIALIIMAATGFYSSLRYPIMESTLTKNLPIHFAISLLAAFFSALFVNLLVVVSGATELSIHTYFPSLAVALSKTMSTSALAYWVIVLCLYLWPYRTTLEPSQPISDSVYKYVQTDKIKIPTNKGIRIVRCDDIDWIEAQDYYLRVHFQGGKLLYRKRMKELDRLLDSSRFVRIHRSAIVNLDRIASIVPSHHGGYSLTLTDGTQLKVSRSRKEIFDKAVNQLSL